MNLNLKNILITLFLHPSYTKIKSFQDQIIKNPR